MGILAIVLIRTLLTHHSPLLIKHGGQSKFYTDTLPK